MIWEILLVAGVHKKSSRKLGRKSIIHICTLYELNVKHSFVQCYSAEYVTDRDVLTEQSRTEQGSICRGEGVG